MNRSQVHSNTMTKFHHFFYDKVYLCNPCKYMLWQYHTHWLWVPGGQMLEKKMGTYNSIVYQSDISILFLIMTI